jgi:hypothetical protein
MYGIFEYQKFIINNPDITLNIITNVVSFMDEKKVKKDDDRVVNIYKMILNVKKIEDLKLIENYMNK